MTSFQQTNKRGKFSQEFHLNIKQHQPQSRVFVHSTASNKRQTSINYQLQLEKLICISHSITASKTHSVHSRLSTDNKMVEEKATSSSARTPTYEKSLYIKFSVPLIVCNFNFKFYVL